MCREVCAHDDLSLWPDVEDPAIEHTDHVSSYFADAGDVPPSAQGNWKATTVDKER